MCIQECGGGEREISEEILWVELVFEVLRIPVGVGVLDMLGVCRIRMIWWRFAFLRVVWVVLRGRVRACWESWVGARSICVEFLGC